MDSDDEATIDDPEDVAWVAQQRELVTQYLASQRVDHGGVSVEPRWFLSPYVAVWAVRSAVDPERVGWWAISGDVPTDYMTCANERDDGDVLIAFATRWRAAARRMAAGLLPDDGFTIGSPEDAADLAPLLATRAELLYDFGVAEKDDEPEGAG